MLHCHQRCSVLRVDRPSPKRGAGTRGWEITLLTCTCISWKMVLSTDTASPGDSTSHMLWGQEKKSKNRKL